MSSAEELFKQQFGKSPRMILPKHDLENKDSNRKTKRIKKEKLYIPIRINQEESEKYEIYFVRLETRKDKKILNDFKKKIEEYELIDLVYFEEINLDISKFKKMNIKAIKEFIDINSDIFSNCFIKKEPLTGNFIKKIYEKEEEKKKKEEEEKKKREEKLKLKLEIENLKSQNNDTTDEEEKLKKIEDELIQRENDDIPIQEWIQTKLVDRSFISNL